VVEIGGIAVAIRADDENFLQSVRQRYAGFLSVSSPDVELDVDLSARGPVSDEDVHVCRDGRDWLMERGDFRARWNPESGRGQVKQSSNPYALDSVLRILHSLILARRGGFLLHAASAVLPGEPGARAFLFSGVSGAGKTTIARLAPQDALLLSDEISYVRPAGSGYMASGTPFSGELAEPGENCDAPLSALFFLEKGPGNRIEEIPVSEAIRRLMRNILFFAEDHELVEPLLAAACHFVEKVPVRRLTFYPDNKVWGEVRDFEALPEHV